MVLLRAVEAMQKQLLEELREFRKEASDGREVRARLDTRRKADSERQARWRSRNVSHGDNNVISPVVDLDPKLGDQDLKGRGRRDNNVSHVRNGKADTGPTRKSFENAYMARYGVSPTWNETTNSQMARFVKRIGVIDAPAVAEFYVSHNSVEYVKKMHPVGRLLNDAEPLHGQWKKGTQITSGQAVQADKTQTNIQTWDALRPKGAANGVD